MYVCTDVKDNTNKFWAYEHDGVNITYRWGRVGHAEQKKTMAYTPGDLQKKIREKEKKEYKLLEVLSEVNLAPPANSNVKNAAFEQLAGGDQTLTDLIERLVAANRHELLDASGGKISVNLQTGAVTTPLGAVTKDTIQKARGFLDIIAPLARDGLVDDPEFTDALEEYLQLVPQRVGHAKGWHRYFIYDDTTVQKQSQFLDQLEASADFALASVPADAKAPPKVFDTKITLVDDPMIIRYVNDMFEKSRNLQHQASRLRVRTVYAVHHGPMIEAFKRDGGNLDNQWELWHGTRTFNVLSILKNGLIIPKATGNFHITGRMFGDGIYFSDQSTKALNYAQGYWDGGSKDNRCFMFLAKVAMGKYFTPRSGYDDRRNLPKPGYDSTYAIGGTSGVMNNEMIVYRTGQAVLQYLVEFEPR